MNKKIRKRTKWFMLCNWIEYNNYLITIGSKRRKILADYYSRSNGPNSRSAKYFSYKKWIIRKV